MRTLALCCLVLSACTLFFPGSSPNEQRDASADLPVEADMMPPPDLAPAGGPLWADEYLQIDLADLLANLDPGTVARAPAGYQVVKAWAVRAISPNGHLAGTITVEYGDVANKKLALHAALWRRLGWDHKAGRPIYLLHDIGLLWSDISEETHAYAVNSAGQVVGAIGFLNGISEKYHAFFYDPEVDQLLEIGRAIPSSPVLSPDLTGKIKWSGEFADCEGRAAAYGVGEPRAAGAAIQTEVVGNALFKESGACTNFRKMSAIRWLVQRRPAAPRLSVTGVSFLGVLWPMAGNDTATDANFATAINRSGTVLGSDSGGVVIYGPTPYAAPVSIPTAADDWHLSDTTPGQGTCPTAFGGDTVVVADGAWEVKLASGKASRLKLPSTNGGAMAHDVTPDGQLIVGTTKTAVPMRWRWSCMPEPGYVEAPLPDPGILTDLLAVNQCGEIIATVDEEDYYLLVPNVAVAGCPR